MQFEGGYLEPLMDTLYDSLRAILDINGFNNVPIIYSMSNSPETLNTYCLIDILNIEQVGRSDEGTFIVPQTEVLEFNTHYKIYIQLASRGDSSSSVASSLHHNMNNRKCYEEFHKRNLAILNKSNLRRAPQLRETRWVDGYNFDMNLTFSIFTRQSFDWVEYITVNGEVFKVPYKE